MRLQLYCLTGSLLLIAALSGCGTPGAPQPPSLQLARPVDDLTASRKGNRVELDWTLQRKNTDRTLVKHSARNPRLPPRRHWTDEHLRRRGRGSST